MHVSLLLLLHYLLTFLVYTSNEKLPFVEAYLVYTEFTILYVLD